MFNEILRPKYSNVTFYIHNMGGYGIVFLLKVLYDYNDMVTDGVEKYIIKCELREDKIIRVIISKGKDSITILYSYAMLP